MKGDYSAFHGHRHVVAAILLTAFISSGRAAGPTLVDSFDFGPLDEVVTNEGRGGSVHDPGINNLLPNSWNTRAWSINALGESASGAISTSAIPGSVVMSHNGIGDGGPEGHWLVLWYRFGSPYADLTSYSAINLLGEASGTGEMRIGLGDADGDQFWKTFSILPLGNLTVSFDELSLQISEGDGLLQLNEIAGIFVGAIPGPDDFYQRIDEINLVSEVPEPATSAWVLLGAGLALFWTRRKRSASTKAE